MAIITCLECKKEVSDQATTCPQCGYPIANPSAIRAGTPPPIQTIELTAKKWKAWLLFFALVMVASFVSCVGGCVASAGEIKATGDALGEAGVGAMMFGIYLFWGGGIGWVITRILVWWHHR